MTHDSACEVIEAPTIEEARHLLVCARRDLRAKHRNAAFPSHCAKLRAIASQMRQAVHLAQATWRRPRSHRWLSTPGTWAVLVAIGATEAQISHAVFDAFVQGCIDGHVHFCQPVMLEMAAKEAEKIIEAINRDLHPRPAREARTVRRRKRR